MNRRLMELAGFSKELDLVDEGKCPFCSKVVDSKFLRDELSRKEFEISGLCQECQDKIFDG